MIKKLKQSSCIAFTMLLMVSMLVACSSEKAEKEIKEETQQADVKGEAVEKEDIIQPTPEPTPEPTAEPTPEPTPEQIVYEGIDMESTLPGKEWMLTFEGIINEPKAVLFNDTTNKKTIIEYGQKVFYEAGDIFAIYIPDGDMWLSEYSGIRTNGLKSYNNYYNEFTFEKEYLDMPKTFKVVISNKNKPIELRYEFQPMD